MSITIDLNTKVIPPDQSIWIVHSGRNRSYTDIFKTESVVFLEFPGLDLRPEDIENDTEIRRELRYSLALRANRGEVREDGTVIERSQFHGLPDTDVSVHLRTVKHLFSRIHQGDLIVVPGRGAEGSVLFGEVRGDFYPAQTIILPNLDYAPTPVRHVNWIKERPKFDLTPDLIRYFEKPPAIAQVYRDRISERFFDYAYDAYAMTNKSFISIDAPNYDGRDFLALVPPTELLALAVSVYTALERSADISGLSYDEIIERFYDEAILADAKLKFTSPGNYNLKDRDGYLARFVNAFIAAAMAGALSACSAGTPVEFVNSQAPNDATTTSISKMVEQASKSAGDDVLKKAEKQAADAKAKLGFRPPGAKG